MKYPEQYPNGFLYAAHERLDTSIIEEGLVHYWTAMHKALGDMPACDAPLDLYMLKCYQDSIESAIPKAKVITNIIEELFPGFIVTEVAPRE